MHNLKIVVPLMAWVAGASVPALAESSAELVLRAQKAVKAFECSALFSSIQEFKDSELALEKGYEHATVFLSEQDNLASADIEFLPFEMLVASQMKYPSQDFGIGVAYRAVLVRVVTPLYDKHPLGSPELRQLVDSMLPTCRG